MKHKGIIVTLVAMLLSVMLLQPEVSWAKPAVPEHTDAFYVNDFAGVIDLKAENYMVNYGVKLHQETGAQVVLVTVESTGGAAMEEYAKTLFNSWGIGEADKDNGVLLLLSVKDDDYWVLQGDGLKAHSPTVRCRRFSPSHWSRILPGRNIQPEPAKPTVH